MSSFKKILTTPFFDLEATEETDPLGEPYYRMRSANSVIICVLDHSDRFLLVRQYRPNIEYQTLEFPAGAIEPNETQADAAHREFEEETGHLSSLLKIGSARLMMNRSTNKEFLFFGVGATLSKSPCVDSSISLEKIQRHDFIEMVKEDKFEQLAALGLLAQASLRLGLDLFASSFEEIQTAFSKQLGTEEANY